MICIGFGSSDDFKSRLIRWVTDSEYSHTWIEYPSECWGGQWVAHATERGVVKEPAERVHRRYDRICLFDTRGIDLAKGMRASKDLLGCRYDFKIIWNALLLILYRWTKCQWLWKFASRDISKVSCSEFVMTVVQNSDEVEKAKQFDAEFIKPGEVFNFCSDVFLVKGGGTVG